MHEYDQGNFLCAYVILLDVVLVSSRPIYDVYVSTHTKIR